MNLERDYFLWLCCGHLLDSDRIIRLRGKSIDHDISYHNDPESEIS